MGSNPGKSFQMSKVEKVLEKARITDQCANWARRFIILFSQAAARQLRRTVCVTVSGRTVLGKQADELLRDASASVSSVFHRMRAQEPISEVFIVAFPGAGDRCEAAFDKDSHFGRRWNACVRERADWFGRSSQNVDTLINPVDPLVVQTPT